jgi:hypothetical protein
MPVETPTPEPTPSEMAAASVVPYSGEATCANLIDPSTLTEFTQNNASLTGADWSEKIVGELLDNPQFGVDLATFTLYGGISCGWGNGYENFTMYGYGPITDAQKTAAIASLEERGFTLKGDRYEADEEWGTFSFGTGNWAGAFVNGGDNLLDEVVANAPAWSSPEKLSPPSDTPLPTTAATPATAPYLTTEGLGDLRLGTSVPSTNDFVSWHKDTCFGAWLPKSPYGDYQEGTAALELIAKDHKKAGKLQFILLHDDSIPTKSGVRVGDSEARLLATYKDLEKLDAEDSTVYGVKGDAGRVVFEVATHDSLIGAYRAGQITSIAAIAYSLSDDLMAPSQWEPCTM